MPGWLGSFGHHRVVSPPVADKAQLIQSKGQSLWPRSSKQKGEAALKQRRALPLHGHSAAQHHTSQPLRACGQWTGPSRLKRSKVQTKAI